MYRKQSRLERMPDWLRVPVLGLCAAGAIFGIMAMRSCTHEVYKANIAEETGGVVQSFETVWLTNRCGLDDDSDTAVNAVVQWKDGSKQRIKLCCNLTECY